MVKGIYYEWPDVPLWTRITNLYEKQMNMKFTKFSKILQNNELRQRTVYNRNTGIAGWWALMEFATTLHNKLFEKDEQEYKNLYIRLLAQTIDIFGPKDWEN